MKHGWHWQDALEVGLALGLIFSFLWCALSRIFLADLAREGRRIRRARESGVYVEPPRRRSRNEDLPPAEPRPAVRRPAR